MSDEPMTEAGAVIEAVTPYWERIRTLEEHLDRATTGARAANGQIDFLRRRLTVLEAALRPFAGQTGGICDGRRYDYDAKEYQPTDCGPHGVVIYRGDLRNFLEGGRVVD